jgi:RIO-like serine/threonine protein kinase
LYSLQYRTRLPVWTHHLLNKELLKKDLFGEVWTVEEHGEAAILRDTRPARWWLVWLARSLLHREVNALAALSGIDGVPQLIRHDGRTLVRSFLPGVAMHVGRPESASYFRDAARLLRRIHTAGVAHNDLAKEANILLSEDGSPAFVDFQLAACSARRGRFFRIAAREDIRHLLKHKRTYRPDLLTTRELGILSSPSSLSRAWMSLVKPLYMFVTRRILGWADREGAADRK